MGIKEKFIKSCDELKNYADKVTKNVKNDYKRSSLRNELDEMYLTLGRIKYAESLNSGETSEEAQPIVAEITRLIAEIETLNTEINRQKICRVCGKDISDDQQYCAYCGAKKENIEQ